jgi:hypothetical protein
VTRFSREYGEKLATAQAAARRAKVESESRPQVVSAQRKPAAVTSYIGEPPPGTAAPSGQTRKHGNIPTDGFGSKREARRAAVLMQREARGEIRNLRCQVKYILIPAQRINGELVERACTYTADFVYEQYLPPPEPIKGNTFWRWQTVVEDTKGFPNDRWPIKRKLMLFVHNIRVKEV